ncbi:hypothetical protein [Streptomyces sp. NBC_01187]|uniref:hypothetical protein n=1 Tax=Streptomyces sp. NBC_01187 TaxID=2903766 RepID=UPI002F90C24E|nr:hypothetical protein OG220_42005 [Streptomyces sp. NBC_01187]
MSETDERRDIPKDRWVFGLEEIPAIDRGEDGAYQRAVVAFDETVICAPEGTPQALVWAAEEIVSQCGPDDWAVCAVLLQWLRIEAGDELRLGVESCLLERIPDDRIRLQSHYSQWEELDVPIADVRRMLIDMMHFFTKESRHPLPSWRIRRLGEGDWAQKGAAE